MLDPAVVGAVCFVVGLGAGAMLPRAQKPLSTQPLKEFWEKAEQQQREAEPTPAAVDEPHHLSPDANYAVTWYEPKDYPPEIVKPQRMAHPSKKKPGAKKKPAARKKAKK